MQKLEICHFCTLTISVQKPESLRPYHKANSVQIYYKQPPHFKEYKPIWSESRWRCITNWTELPKHFRFLLHVSHFFPHSNLSWSWCCAMKLIHKGLNIEQLLNFSLLHNDYVIWLNNVHTVKSEKNLCTKNSLLQSNVLQVHCELKRSGLSPQLCVRDPCSELMLVFSLKKCDFISLPDMKFSIKYRSELTAIVRRLCFYRKTLHSFTYEMQIPAYREHSSFRENQQTQKLRILCDMHWSGWTDSIIIHKLIIILKFLRNADQQ